MSIKIRRIICLLFYLIFFIATPLIIAYAAGYKFDFNKGRLQKTGIFILDSQPQNAKVFINNQAIKTFFFNKTNNAITPIKIKNLLPGEYTIRLELDGYWPWEKKLKITQGNSTYAEDILLFKQSSPTLLMSTNSNNIQLSPNKEKLAILNKNQLVILDLTDKTEQKTSLEKEEQSLSWSADNQKIILTNSIYDANNLNNKITIADLADKDATKLFWNNNKLYYQSNDSINFFDLTNETSKKIIENQKIDNYFIKNNNLYVLTNLETNYTLNIFEINNMKLVGSINLPVSSKFSFINIEQKTINLYDQNNQTLYLINPTISQDLKTIKKIDNIKYSFWINDSKLLYANDFEIWLYDTTNEKKTLITRISDNITGIIWHPSNNYVIYSTNKTINTIEMDDREKKNSAELIKSDKIRSLFIDPKSASLYFLAKPENQEGLYTLQIK